jgi:tetratricopeptide (TPR) repeat protein
MADDRFRTIGIMKLGRVARPAPTVASLLEKYKPGTTASLFPGKQGIADMSRAIAIDPKAGEAYFHRGQMRVADSDYAGALEDFAAATARNAKSPLMPKYEGIANYYLHNYEKAIVALQQANALADSENPPEEGFFSVGSRDDIEDLLFESLMQVGNYKAALKLTAIHIEGGLDGSKYRYQSCAAKARLGEFKSALVECDLGIKDEGDINDPSFRLSVLKEVAAKLKVGVMGDEKAEKLLVRQFRPEKYLPQRCYARAALGSMSALQECENAIDNNPNSAEAYEYLGLGRAALKQPGTAKQAYGQAIALYETMGNQVAVKRVEALVKLLPRQ